MKLYVAGIDGRVYVSPYRLNGTPNEFCRCLADGGIGKVKVFRMFYDDGSVADNFRFDYEAYSDADMSDEEIMRMEELIDATARMVYDPHEGDLTNALNIADALRGVLKQEGLA
jgi:hypothetical protein